MGLALALGVFVGVRGGISRQIALTLALITALALLSPLARGVVRSIAICAMAGCVLGLLCGLWRAGGPPAPAAADLPGTAQGVVLSDPRVTGAGVRTDLRWHDTTGRSWTTNATLPAAPSVGRGDRIEFSGWISDPVDNYVIVRSQRVIAGPGQMERARRRLRAFVSGSLLREAPGSPGTLSVGLLLGDDSGLTSAERAQLRAAGMSHITAVSGWNVSIVVGAVGALGVALNLRGRWWIIAQLAALVAYVWLVGADPPVVRAALMTTAAFVATQIGRPRHTVTALALTAALLACLQPATTATLSFQLSALATLGVALALQISASWDGWRAALGGPALVSVCAGLATAPLLAAAFGSFTLACVPSNVLAGPLVSTATFAAALVPVAASVGLGVPAGVVVWLCCRLILLIAAIFSAAPLGHWTFAPLSSGATASLYGALAIATALLLPEGRLARRRVAAWAQAEPLPAVGAGLATLAVCALALIVV